MEGTSSESLPFYDALGSPPASLSSQVDSVYNGVSRAVNGWCQPNGSPDGLPSPSPCTTRAPFAPSATDEEDEHIDPFMFQPPARGAYHRKSPSLPNPMVARPLGPAGSVRPALRLHARTKSCGGTWQSTPPPTTPLPPLPLNSLATEGPLDGLLPDRTLDIVKSHYHCSAPPEPMIMAFAGVSAAATPTTHAPTFSALEGVIIEASRLPTVCEAPEHSQVDQSSPGQLSWQSPPSPMSSSHRSRSHTNESASSTVSTDASQSQSSYIDFDSASSVGSCESAIGMTSAPTPMYQESKDGPVVEKDRTRASFFERAIDTAASHSNTPIQPGNPILRDQTGEHGQTGYTAEGEGAAVRRRPSKLIKPSRFVSRSVAPLALGPPRTLPLLHRALSAGSQDAATPTLSTPCSAVPEINQSADDDADDDIATPLDEISSLVLAGKDESGETMHKPERIHSRSLSWTRFKERFR